MCIICLEFNKNRDLMDARRMIEAARREVDIIPEEHLEDIEEELKKIEKGLREKLDLEP